MSRRTLIPSEDDIYTNWGLLGGLYEDVHRERIRAHAKHDDHGQSMERKTFDDPTWLPVLVEEVGEVARALCDYSPGCEKEDRIHLIGKLRGELIQVAAMACAWVDAIDLDNGDGDGVG